jgi:hypothetical protein
MTDEPKRPPSELIREYPYTVGALLALLVLLTVISGINAAVTSGNSSRLDALQKTQAAQQKAAAAAQRNSAVFIKTFLDAQLAECEAILDADHRLGAASVDPRICVIALPTQTGANP